MRISHKNIPDVFEKSARKYSKNIFLQIKKNNYFVTYTYEQTYLMVKSLAFKMSKLTKRGDNIAILSENRPEWCIAYLSIVSAGCTAVPLDTNLSDENLVLFLNHSDSVLILLSQNFFERMINIQPKIKKLKHIICFDGQKHAQNFSFERVFDTDFDITKNSKLSDVASLIYTSGTSGHPKAVMLTHENLISDLTFAGKKFDITQKDSFIVLLPLHHIFAFTTIFLFSSSVGASMSFVKSLKKNEIFETIKETNTTVVFGVPKIFESIYDGIVEKISEQTFNKKMIVKSLKFANAASVNLFKRNFGKLLFKQIHAQIGDKIRLMVSGGAAINKDVLVGMYLLGFPITEGYGLTETSPVVAVNEIGTKFGSVGKPLEGVAVKIVEPNEEGIGEIAIKGQIVMKGYYKNEQLTKQTIKDGWLHTKDLGCIDKDGYLYIKGRKDNVIILPSGKNVYPEDVEYHYAKSQLIQEICVLGIKPKDIKQEVVHALIVPNDEEMKKRGVTDSYNAVREEVEAYSKNIPAYKRIFSFDIVDKDSLPKTSTLKFKKFEIRKRIEANEIKGDKMQIKPKDDDSVKNAVFKNLKKYSGKSDFNLNSHLELDLKLDSLAIAEIISNVEQELKIKIPYDITPNLSTVQDIINLVSKNADEKTIESGKTTEIISEEDSLVPLRTDYSEEASKERIKWLANKTKFHLSYLLGRKFPVELLKGNIEHYIGMSQIPTGIAGPLRINGEYAKGIFYVPLATTEGALVASANRGMNIITKSGGANAKVISEQMTKAPVFAFKNAEQAIQFEKWIDKNFEKLKSIAESTTKYGRLTRIDKFLLGRKIILRLCYSCGDAMGANMITMATQRVCNYIKDNYKIMDYNFQSNLEGEKKVSFMNFLDGRGRRAYADAIIKKNLVEKFLHTSVDRIVEVAQNSLYGSIMGGMIGTNAHIANIVTAVFIATGQDAAHVHDSSVGITTIEKTKEGDLYIAVNLPSLAIGTVGGGTGIGTQKECLEILGCAGTEKANKFAEIIAASVLAGELSLAGSQSAGDFAFAHNKLGRNKPESKKLQ